MSAATSYSFWGYTLRPATADDLELAHKWTLLDDAHRDKIAPGFWLEQDAGVDSYLLLDDIGPLFFFRMQRVVRLFIQFNPRASDSNRARRGLLYGLQWLQSGLVAVGVTEIVFDSLSTLLRRFVIGRLGFTAQPHTLTRSVFASAHGPQAFDLADTPSNRPEARPKALPQTLQAGG